MRNVVFVEVLFGLAQEDGGEKNTNGSLFKYRGGDLESLQEGNDEGAGLGLAVSGLVTDAIEKLSTLNL